MEHLAPELTLEEFGSSVHQHKLILVDFYATWCEPCKYLDEILQEIEPKIKDNVIIVKADIDEQKELAQHYTIRSVPTLFIFKEGKEVWRMPGFMLAHEMIKKLEEFY
jgi:thioredoxin 1